MDLRCDTLFDDELSREWDILLAQSSADSVFLTSAWLRAWHETFGRYSPLIVPQVRTDGHLIAAAAFLLSNGVIEFAGAGPSDYSDFVTSRHIDDNLRIRAIDALLVEAKAAAQSFRYFRLGRVQPESETLKSIAEPQIEIHVDVRRRRHGGTLPRHGARRGSPPKKRACADMSAGSNDPEVSPAIHTSPRMQFFLNWTTSSNCMWRVGSPRA
jgi:hypothetical protein